MHQKGLITFVPSSTRQSLARKSLEAFAQKQRELLCLLGHQAKNISKYGLHIFMHFMYMSRICKYGCICFKKCVMTTELKIEKLESFSFSS